MEKIAASISRKLYVLPGGYFIVQVLRKIFGREVKIPSWREFSFRGMQMKVDISKNMGMAIYWRGAHDWRPIFVMEKILKKGQTFIDIGANQGEYAIWAARKTGWSGKVIAFEPMDALFSQLEANFALNPKYEKVFLPIKMGLSDKQGQLELYGKSGSNEGVNTIYPTASHDVFLQSIPLDTLDHQLQNLNLDSVDLIKIDVEGAELQVLKGAVQSIEKYRPNFIIEINPESCLAAGYKAADILSFLKEKQYMIFKIGLRGKLKPISRLDGEFCNILALRNHEGH